MVKMIKSPSREPDRWILPTFLVAALVVLIGSALIVNRHINRFAETAKWVSHTRHVIATTESLMLALSKAESAGRGYLISRDPIYRKQFEEAVEETVTGSETLRTLTLDNPEQQARLVHLTDLIKPKISLLRKFVSVYDTPDVESAQVNILLAVGTKETVAIYRIVEDIQQTEGRLLAERSSRFQRRLELTRIYLATSTVVGLSVAGGMYFLLRRHWRLQSLSASSAARHQREKLDLTRYNDRLLDSTGEGLYGIDNEGRCTFINKAGMLILGGNSDAFLGKEMHELVHHTRADGQPFPKEDCPIYHSCKVGDGCRVADEVFWRLDGRPVPVEYSSFPIKDDGGAMEGAVISFNDISARVRSKQELQVAMEAAEAANESKSDFLANMSHELRTPLNAVIMYSELLTEEAEDRDLPEFVSDLGRIRGAGKHLLELVNSVLDLSKVEAGKMEVFTESFDIPNMINEVAEMVKPLVEKNGNSLQIKIKPGVESMHGDLTKLRQVLYNLISNASKFTENGTIDLNVCAGDERDEIEFRVADSGIGMSEEQVSRLFQPFMQADASTSRKYGGTGLGLAIIRRFTDLMDGEVSVESVAGQGTTFTVRVPKTFERGPRTSEGEPGSGELVDLPVTGGGKVVLIIDDDPSIRDILTRVLLSEGLRPVTAGDGSEGLKRARDLAPDLIILDVLMPKIDGWSVLSTLKADPELSEIPVIIQSVSDDRALGYMLGATEYLVKPVDRTKLVTLLRKYVTAEHAEVLVVDDDEGTRRALMSSLTTQGWQVQQAANGIEALEQMEQTTPAAILLDLIMPEMDGFEFLQELHKKKDWQAIPVIVLTSKELTAADRKRLNGSVERILAKGEMDHDSFLYEVKRVVANVTRMPLEPDPKDSTNAPNP